LPFFCINFPRLFRKLARRQIFLSENHLFKATTLYPSGIRTHDP
jgi:hypothetical protein